MSETLCPCGSPLHYGSAETQRLMERIVAEKGERIEVTVEDTTWLVPRHYIALHGLLGSDLPSLEGTFGIERVSADPNAKHPCPKCGHEMKRFEGDFTLRSGVRMDHTYVCLRDH